MSQDPKLGMYEADYFAESSLEKGAPFGHIRIDSRSGSPSSDLLHTANAASISHTRLAID